ncbi:MAG: RDD family protein [Deltaproteobacteria bacterium]|nr:RDD family protein [Deltaproteobacteria bacterium]
MGGDRPEAVVRDVCTIRTPENVEFEFELADLPTRAMAWLVDILVMIGAVVTLATLVSYVGFAVGELGTALVLLFMFLVQWFYGMVAEWRFAGRTIGKAALGLRVIDARGIQITFMQAAVRNLVRIVDLLPGLYGVGATTALLDRHARRLGDIAAGTIVVRERRVPVPSRIVPQAERYNTFVDDPRVRAVARRISAAERDAMVGLALRRDELPLSVRSELFARLAAHLAKKLALPRPSTFSDEKYVLNLTAVALGAEERRREGRPGFASASVAEGPAGHDREPS